MNRLIILKISSDRFGDFLGRIKTEGRNYRSQFHERQPWHHMRTWDLEVFILSLALF
jgi:hypothetical protein